jgi:hypothetical protein
VRELHGGKAETIIVDDVVEELLLLRDRDCHLGAVSRERYTQKEPYPSLFRESFLKRSPRLASCSSKSARQFPAVQMASNSFALPDARSGSLQTSNDRRET